MNREFIPYEQALELKELGFEATPLGGFKQDAVFYYENGELYYDYRPMYSSTAHEGQIIAPLYQQAFRWFRETPGLVALIDIGMHEFSYKIFKNEKSITPFKDYLDYNGTYEEAELECLKKLIEIANTKKK
jgi:hypothetical protein